MAETFYKIRRRDGLFSSGGHYPNFSKKGKIWRTMGHLRNHLNSLAPGDRYNDCEIIELVSTEHIVCSVRLELEAIQNRERDRQNRERDRQRVVMERARLMREKEIKEQEEKEKQKLVELLKKYPEFEKVETEGKIIKRG